MAKFAAAVSGYMGTHDGKTFGYKIVASGEHLMGMMGKRAEEDRVWAE